MYNIQDIGTIIIFIYNNYIPRQKRTQKKIMPTPSIEIAQGKKDSRCKESKMKMKVQKRCYKYTSASNQINI